MRLPSAAKSKIGVILGQLELLQELAVATGDTQLADDLNLALANALFRHFDAMTPAGGTDPSA